VVSFEASIAVIVSFVLWFIYRGSVDLDEKRHWIIRMFLFYGAVALGWAALNLALTFATVGGASALLSDSIQNVYYAYSIIAIVLVFYIGWLFFSFTFLKLLDIAKIVLGRKPNVEDEQAW